MKVKKVKSQESQESNESYESDQEQAFSQEYSSKSNFVLVPNNSQDRTYIYDFSKDESVKTIN
jgi:6-phosphogluconolactonase (cycloisomerase 2 family)